MNKATASLLQSVQNFFSIENYTSRKMHIVLAIVIGVLIPDTLINQVSDFLVPQSTSVSGIIFFIAISVVYGIGQYLFLQFIKVKTLEIRSKLPHLNKLYMAVKVIQWLLFTILLYLILQIILFSQYSLILSMAATAISLTLNALLLSILSNKFISWYRSNKKSMVVLVYSVGFGMISITSILAMTLDMYNFSINQTHVITPTSKISFPSFDDKGKMAYVLHKIYHYTDILSFIFVWGGTALLLHRYSNVLGKTRFWILISLPLVYYVSTLIDLFGLYTPQSDSEAFLFYLYTSLNSTAGGILFGYAFLSVAKNIRHSAASNYLTISAYGLVLLFISNQVTLVAASYPPFGFATLCLAGFSAYMVLLGLYSTAISVSRDNQLRKSLLRSVKDQGSRLLDNIGTSQIEYQLRKIVAEITEDYSDKMDEETRIYTPISTNEVRQYLDEILKEIAQHRR